ncbi:MAG TPA: TIM barrel protein [Roseiflexaceae bacterium]|nr:TIM barrel protein [Roseiflexaceae bacterium]
MTTSPTLSVSTWSLHRALGRPGFYGPADARIPAETHGRGALTLLELPARLAAFGIRTLEICHFHLPARDPSYLRALRGALEAAGVRLFSLLVDDGDVTGPEAARDLEWIRGWLPVATVLGAERVRVIAGKSEPSEETLARSVAALEGLAADAASSGLRLMTENWFALLSRPDTVLALLDRLEGRVGLCLDFGNWGGEGKYERLAAIAPRAESCHAKAHFVAPNAPDREDYTRCLELTRAAGFSGPYTLIYDGPGDDEWAGLSLERELVRPFL